MTLLGAGGAAKSIYSASHFGWCQSDFGLCSFRFYEKNKTSPRQVTGADRLLKVDLYALEDVSELQARIADSGLLVNATSVGMDGQSSPVPENINLTETLLVADIIYQPFETPFLKWARSQGNPAVNGLGMLLYQAAEAFQLWTGKRNADRRDLAVFNKKYQ